MQENAISALSKLAKHNDEKEEIMETYMIVQWWIREFDSYEDEFKKVAVWIKVLVIPIEYYNLTFLSRLGSTLGKTIKVDMNTINFTDDDTPRVERGLGFICFECGKYGHRKNNCLDKVENRENQGGELGDDGVNKVEKAKEVKVGRTEVGNGAFGPWMLVTQKERRKPIARLNNQRVGKVVMPYGSKTIAPIGGSRFVILSNDDHKNNEEAVDMVMNRRVFRKRGSKEFTQVEGVKEKRDSLKAMDSTALKENVGRGGGSIGRRGGRGATRFRERGNQLANTAMMRMYKPFENHLSFVPETAFSLENLNQTNNSSERKPLSKPPDKAKRRSRSGTSDKIKTKEDASSSVKECVFPTQRLGSHNGVIVKEMRRDFKVDIMFICEPRASGRKDINIIKRCGWKKFEVEDAQGFFGGDFNAYSYLSDKKGGVGPNWSSMGKFNYCLNSFKVWNKKKVSNIFKKEKDLLARIEGIDKKLSEGRNDFLTKLRCDLCKDYENVLLQEESLWKKKNHVKTLKNDQDIWVEDEEDLNDQWIHVKESVVRFVKGAFEDPKKLAKVNQTLIVMVLKWSHDGNFSVKSTYEVLIAVVTNLEVVRHILGDASCPRCRRADKSCLHVVKDYREARDLWKKLVNPCKWNSFASLPLISELKGISWKTGVVRRDVTGNLCLG
ncbi:uncharacterized protein G2W53_008299 [Senna tora]|uniref:CCHC-type domain-containing protein n=1 Tax=Senna tora TaxID=362788 RepID=A0A834X8G1_9FABA|nr:uncharacterized protein G2W53_008299 [Senna tora]